MMSDRYSKTTKRGALISVSSVACLLFAFGVVAQNVIAGTSFELDQKIMLALRDQANPSAPIGPAWLQEAARDLTSLGSIIVLAMIAFTFSGYLFLTRKHAAAWLILVAVYGGIALNDLLKAAFARPRPDLIYQAVRVFTSSFPSGHAELSATTYLTIAAVLAQNQSSFKVGLYFIVVAVFLTIPIGISRIYLGVHYPTDVFGGWCVGAAWALGCWVFLTWLQHRNHSL
ncbi:MAG TPA: phosphatase PAP2 family protein [Xanthobacteraceae bacterium]|nr:phosphatase PAP2 family protein [Xanthobacteraceae bacterium]